MPNFPLSQRPIFLCASKESESNIRSLMSSLINPETDEMKKSPEGKVDVEIVRYMFDGKKSAILSGAGGASCQKCTATHNDLKARELVIQGLLIK